jgi:glycosyltransferase involved in cell wall biosynthesis
MPKLLRITTVPISLHKLLQGQFAYMQEKGFEVFLASSAGKEIHTIEEEIGLKVHILPLKRNISLLNDIKALWATYILIKRIQPDIVHTHTPKAGLIGMLAARLAGVPICMHTVAGLPLMEAKGLKKKVLEITERITSFCATQIYPNSFALQNYMLQHKLVSKSKAKVIANGSSNGIDFSHFDPNCYKPAAKERLKASLFISNHDFVYTFIGRLVGDKGINELVEAFTQLTKNRTQSVVIERSRNEVEVLEGAGVRTSPLSFGEGLGVRLLLVGTPEPELDPLSPETQQQLKKNPHIIQVGWQEDVRPYLAISDVFVFPSYREGMPNVVLQAGAMGLPQIVTDINGSNEIIILGENGIIIPAKQVEPLYAAMYELMLNYEKRNYMSQNARKHIANRFEQKVVWEALLNEYYKLINEK